MTRIVYIPINQLEHHPNNPRGDLGDLTELTASIRESGIMQNLTVVPTTDCNSDYWVVIGNRRLEAAKAAGLEELPCIISDMDARQQLATMLAENMQRVDLTLLEQAQGVQQMMDLGMDVADVAKRTGLRKSAVERRRTMMQYNPEAVEKAVARGGTLMDFADLSKINDARKREALLMDIGTPNFRNRLRGAMEDQRDWELAEALAKKLDAFATRIERVGMVGEREQKMLDKKRWHRPRQKEIDEVITPADVRERRYYYSVSTAYPCVALYVECDGATDAQEIETAEQMERNARREQLQGRMRMAEEACKRHRQLRYDFLDNGAGLKLDREYLVGQLMEVVTGEIGQRTSDSVGRMCELLGVRVINAGAYNARPKEDEFAQTACQRQAFTAAAVLMSILDTERVKPYYQDYVSDVGACRPEHRRSEPMARWYRILEHIGYEMSDEERQMMDGTHECYKEGSNT